MAVATVLSSLSRINMKRIGLLCIGLASNAAIVWSFDFILYPYVIWKFGIVLAFPILLILSFLICYASLVFYDWSKQDWLGIETIKEAKTYSGDNWFRIACAWALKRSDPVAIVFLSIKFDPFITVLYMREGSHTYEGLSRRDWTIFLLSLLLGNVYWALATLIGVTLFEWAWQLI